MYLSEAKRNNINLAMMNLEKAIELEPENVKYYFDHAQIYLALRDYNSAIEDYYYIISIDKNNADAYYGLGYAKTDLGKYQEGIEDFTQAIRINSNHADAYLHRGINYNTICSYQNALDDANKAEKLAFAQGNLATARRAQGFKKAVLDSIETTNQLTSVLPGLRETLSGMGGVKENNTQANANLEIPKLQSCSGIDYTNLDELLKVQKWSEADLLTQEIIVEFVKKSEPYLYEESDSFDDFSDENELDIEEYLFLITDGIKYIPYEDIVIMDTLWVKYSQGHFGFSVQKKIVDSIIGKKDEESQYDKIDQYDMFEDFGRYVGWMSEPNSHGLRFFRAHYELYQPSLSAPKGHLPVKYCDDSSTFFEVMKLLTKSKISHKASTVELSQSDNEASTNSTTYDTKVIQDKYKKEFININYDSIKTSDIETDIGKDTSTPKKANKDNIQDNYKKESVKINYGSIKTSDTKTDIRKDISTPKKEQKDNLPMYKEYPVFTFTFVILFGIFLALYLNTGWSKQGIVMMLIHSLVAVFIAYGIAYAIADKKPPLRFM
ncbi:hypothetical protein RIVM261_088740 [Rivularia sp. IAM M-261]|nr:hypothetical protein RIVM261_088740 [Rivularia sp. IAM M-261]